MALRMNRCLVFFSILAAMDKPMPHLLLSVWASASECLSELENVDGMGASEMSWLMLSSRYKLFDVLDFVLIGKVFIDAILL